MQRDVKIGMSVVYQSGEGDPPLSSFPLRAHPALVASVGTNGEVGLVILPFSAYEHVYRGVCPRGKPESTTACWYFPEEA